MNDRPQHEVAGGPMWIVMPMLLLVLLGYGIVGAIDYVDDQRASRPTAEQIRSRVDAAYDAGYQAGSMAAKKARCHEVF